jgi:hypothetical protein
MGRLIPIVRKASQTHACVLVTTGLPVSFSFSFASSRRDHRRRRGGRPPSRVIGGRSALYSSIFEGSLRLPKPTSRKRSWTCFGKYHAALGPLILSHEGTLERFTGDGMMVFFNDPVVVSNPEERAVRMAVAMRDRVATSTDPVGETRLQAGFRGWNNRRVRNHRRHRIRRSAELCGHRHSAELGGPLCDQASRGRF